MAPRPGPAPADVKRVIDAAVVMTILLGERGDESASQLAPGSMLSSVNLAEIVAKCVEKSIPVGLAWDYIRSSAIEIVAFDADAAILTGEIFQFARKGVLSLGDRACIATAMRRKAIAVTADRIWADLDLPCKIELIR